MVSAIVTGIHLFQTLVNIKRLRVNAVSGFVSKTPPHKYMGKYKCSLRLHVEINNY